MKIIKNQEDIYLIRTNGILKIRISKRNYQ
jgi:hypothetical protein